MIRVNILARLVPEPTLPALRARKDIPDQALPTPQILARPAHRRRNEVPAPANPVAVTPIHELVRAAGEAALGRALQPRQARHQRGHIQILGNSLRGRAYNGEASEAAEGVGAVGLVAGRRGNAAVEGLARGDPLGQPRRKRVEALGARGRVARQRRRQVQQAGQRQRAVRAADVLLAARRHAEPAVAALQRPQPLPHCPPVDYVERRGPAHRRERENGGVCRGQVRQLAGAAAEAAGRVLRRRVGGDDAGRVSTSAAAQSGTGVRGNAPVAVLGGVVAEGEQAGQGPVGDPGAAGVHGDEGRRVGLVQRAPQVPRVLGALQLRHSEGVDFELRLRQPRQALFDRGVLQPRALRLERVADWWVLRE